jgi:hypothetical protein
MSWRMLRRETLAQSLIGKFDGGCAFLLVLYYAATQSQFFHWSYD